MADRAVKDDTPSDVVETLDANGNSSNAAVDANSPSPAPDQADLSLDEPAEEGKADLLSVVQDVVNPSSDEEAAASEDGKDDDAEGQSSSSEDGEVQDAASSDEDEQVPFHEHPRWQALLKERDELRVQAESYGQLQNFIQESSLSTDEFNEGMQIMRAMKLNPAGALEYLRHYVREVEAFVGASLPPELQKRVDDGFLTNEDALLISQAQGQTRQSQVESTLAQQRNTNLVQSQTQTGIADVVNHWEALIAKQDPNYTSQKKPLVMRAMQALILEHGQPTTPEAALDIAKAALAEVNLYVETTRPKPAVKPSTSPLTSTATAGALQAKPRTLSEAVALAASGS
ncbi:MAG: hypothetical protein JKY94_00965 [Rhodobacteraceae bacterium]|nr:hypothetical protein [Paracoccaceae bacterium]